MSTQPTDHWSQFWRQGHTTTFGEALADNYEGAIRDFWTGCFQSLPVQARLLDVATGNGALALLAAQFAAAEGRQWAIDACDLAHINLQVPNNENISLHPRVACEELPFEDNSFDLVSSQFGFEYSDTGRSLAEFFRVLQPAGSFAAVCHHSDSYTLQASRKEQAIYRQALDDNNVFDAAIAYLQARDGGATDAKAKQQAVNDAVNQLRQHHAGHPCCDQIVGALSATLRGAAGQPVTTLLAQLRALDKDFRGAAARLDDLSRAALSAQDLQGLVKHCRQLGFTEVKSGELFHSPGEIAGYTLLAWR